MIPQERRPESTVAQVVRNCQSSVHFETVVPMLALCGHESQLRPFFAGSSSKSQVIALHNLHRGGSSRQIGTAARSGRGVGIDA